MMICANRSEEIFITDSVAVNFELVKDFSSLKVALAPVAGKTEKIFAFLVANRPKCLR
jgi:hypothetical protein